MPEMYSVLVSVLLVLPASLYVFGERLGYIGTALAIVFYQAFQLFFLWWFLAYTKCYHPETWKGVRKSTITKSLRWKPFASFLWLGAGGMLARYAKLTFRLFSFFFRCSILN
jgi:Na+-driven multidrug efflux pump